MKAPSEFETHTKKEFPKMQSPADPLPAKCSRITDSTAHML
jgi:hypothetical protein